MWGTEVQSSLPTGFRFIANFLSSWHGTTVEGNPFLPWLCGQAIPAAVPQTCTTKTGAGLKAALRLSSVPATTSLLRVSGSTGGAPQGQGSVSPSGTNGGTLRPMLMGLRPGLLCLEKEMLTIVLAAMAWEMQDQGGNDSQETAWEPQGHPLK